MSRPGVRNRYSLWRVLLLIFLVVIPTAKMPGIALASSAVVLAEPVEIASDTTPVAKAAALSAAGVLVSPHNGATAPTGANFAAEAVQLANLERAKFGLLPLRHVSTLSNAALGHSTDMAQNNFFNHASPTCGSLANRFFASGYANWCMGAENIAAGHSSPAMVVAAWMKSPGHRANLLNPALMEIGIGYLYQANDQANVRLPNGQLGGPYYHYWTMDLGARANVYPAVINNEAITTTNRNVELAIHGAGSVQQIQISNRADFSGATWQPYAAHRTWTLAPGNGIRTVYVKLRNSFRPEIVDSDSVELMGQPSASHAGQILLADDGPQALVFRLHEQSARLIS